MITLQTYITSISARRDGSIRFSAETPELSKDEKAIFFELQGVVCETAMQPTEDKLPDIEVDKELNQKTPGQRLRAVLYVLWEQKGKQTEFETFYKEKMEKIIEQIKQKLE